MGRVWEGGYGYKGSFAVWATVQGEHSRRKRRARLFYRPSNDIGGGHRTTAKKSFYLGVLSETFTGGEGERKA